MRPMRQRRKRHRYILGRQHISPEPPLFLDHPPHWRDIAWEAFPMQVEWRGITLTPKQFSDAFFDDEAAPILALKYHWQLVDLFNWDYRHMPYQYYGKPISLGVYYDYPKCCIHWFCTHDDVKRSDAQRALTRNDTVDASWILCPSCAEDCAAHGVDAYLAAIRARDELWHGN